MDTSNNPQNPKSDLERFKIDMKDRYGIPPESIPDEFLPEQQQRVYAGIEYMLDRLRKFGHQTVWEFIGVPLVVFDSLLDKAGLSMALEALIAILRQHGIFLFSPGMLVGERRLYRFLTEELLSMTVNKLPVKGIFIIIRYEEFHPGWRPRLADIARVFMHEIFNKNPREGFREFFAENWQDSQGGKVTPAFTAWKKIQAFRDSFESFEEQSLVFSAPEIDEAAEHASIQFEIAYSANIDSNEQLTFSGKGTLRYSMNHKENQWKVCGMQIPGFEI